MTAIRWIVFLAGSLILLLGPGLSQTTPVQTDPSQVNPQAPAASSREAAEAATQTPALSAKLGSADSASKRGTYRRPQRFLRDTAPPLTKPAPLRLGTFSREWAQSRREALAERRRLLWERVKDARNGVPPRREVFQPASVRDKTNSESEVSER